MYTCLVPAILSDSLEKLRGSSLIYSNLWKKGRLNSSFESIIQYFLAWEVNKLWEMLFLPQIKIKQSRDF